MIVVVVVVVAILADNSSQCMDSGRYIARVVHQIHTHVDICMYVCPYLLHEYGREIAYSADPGRHGEIGGEVHGAQRVHSALQLSALVGQDVIPHVAQLHTLLVYGLHYALE